MGLNEDGERFRGPMCDTELSSSPIISEAEEGDNVHVPSPYQTPVILPSQRCGYQGVPDKELARIEEEANNLTRRWLCPKK